MAWIKVISVVVVMIVTVVALDLLESFFLHVVLGSWASVLAISLVVIVYLAICHDCPAGSGKSGKCEDES